MGVKVPICKLLSHSEYIESHLKASEPGDYAGMLGEVRESR